MDILALDVATATGWARGRVDDARPSYGSLNFGKDGASTDQIFARALVWLSGYLAGDTPDLLIMEAMLPPAALKGRTQRAATERLAGLQAIFRAVARLRHVRRVELVQVPDVRRHFLGDNPRRIEAKRRTREECARQGWPVEDDNAADALACWSYACARINPRTALRTSPLFRPNPVGVTS